MGIFANFLYWDSPELKRNFESSDAENIKDEMMNLPGNFFESSFFLTPVWNNATPDLSTSTEKGNQGTSIGSPYFQGSENLSSSVNFDTSICSLASNVSNTDEDSAQSRTAFIIMLNDNMKAKTVGQRNSMTRMEDGAFLSAIWEPSISSNSIILADPIQGMLEEFIPADPLFANQWHLQNLTAGQFDLNVVDVWDDYTGSGVNVIVIDSWVDRTHNDIDTAPQSNFTNSERHGTSVMGIIAAEQGNGIGGVGVAYDSAFCSYRGLGVSYLDDEIVVSAGAGNGVDNTNCINGTSDVTSTSFGIIVTGATNWTFNNDMSAGLAADFNNAASASRAA